MKRIALIFLFIPFLLACFAGTLPPGAPSTPTAAEKPAQVKHAPKPRIATEPPSPTCIVNAESLNVRTSPEGQEEESRVLGWLHNGQAVTVEETRGAWLYIRAEEVSGWIHSTYCTKEK